MTTHIDYAVTEVIAEPDSAGSEGGSGEPDDNRWSEQQKIESTLKHCERMVRRVRAEGFDD